jgi:hypothetical protein
VLFYGVYDLAEVFDPGTAPVRAGERIGHWFARKVASGRPSRRTGSGL